MVKDCPIHGHFEDVMAIDTAFFKHLEEVFPGRDIRAHNDEKLHNHGSSTIKHGRGSVLTVDLTNRCNMMCDPCFMDANQVGFVHELSLGRHQEVLDNAITIKPRRQMSVQFSGGEPTISPYFLDAVRYARKVGYNSVQAATNGIEFAKSPEFAQGGGRGRPALRVPAVRRHRQRRQRAPPRRQPVRREAARDREPAYSAGVDIVPVVTIVNGVNNEQVGRIIEFALDNPKKINFLSFQPVSFTGRDEEVTAERRAAQRYTLSHLAHDVKNQTGLGEPTRDWFPISFMGTFTDWADVMHGAGEGVGPADLRLPPELRRRHGGDDRQGNEGSRAGDGVPQGRAARQGRRRRSTTPAAAGSCRSSAWRSRSCATTTRSRRRRTSSWSTCCKKFDKTFGATKKAEKGDYGKVEGDRTIDDIEKRRADRWNFLFIAGMWFQDLFNYDFRRTEMCIIPYATQQGEISFCAYNTGIGWRNIIEKMHMTATLTKWYEEHGRHEIFAGGKAVPLNSTAHSLKLNEEAVRAGAQTDLDELGIAKNAREEKLKARARKRREAARRSTTRRWPSSTGSTC